MASVRIPACVRSSKKYAVLSWYLNERQRRLVAAADAAQMLGHLIGNTTTKAGLRIQAGLVRQSYRTGNKGRPRVRWQIQEFDQDRKPMVEALHALPVVG